ncbi:hypothetical protein [Williamsia sp. CHRR-6]|uniref:hypothetical protein n=1 Tax=Williamsia sp. CHRR-6 TaxID=2835871 RepID=UPI001BD94F92|nr:hypothetical protein [Williamsia sp. CHRR-6]MBT0566061.1 hypothetical protein [Williamsia sp. CHRR-6]
MTDHHQLEAVGDDKRDVPGVVTTMGRSAVNHRGRAVAAWSVAAAASISASALYAAQVVSAFALRTEMLKTCDSHEPPLITHFFWLTMILAGTGAIAASVALSTSRRRLWTILGVVVIVVCSCLFLLSWYGTSVADDTIMPPCSNL